MSEFRSRVLAPIMVPIVALIGAAILVFAFSRVLLAVPKYWSTSLAMLLAAEVLGVAAIIAAVRRITGAQKILVGLLGAMVLIGGGVGVASGIRPIEAHGNAVTVVATDILFEEEEFTMPADEPFTMEFVNNDANIPHNVSIYEDDSFSNALFLGETFSGVATVVYDIPAIPEGTYAFRCDVHPIDMVGTAVAEAGAGHGGGSSEDGDHGEDTEDDHGGEASGDALTVVALNFVFDTDTITVEAGSHVEMLFRNEDENIPHNVAVYTDDSFSEVIFQGEIFNGIAEETYEFDAPPAGEYAFRCDLHPDMKGVFISE